MQVHPIQQQFSDSAFRVFDGADNTKKFALEVSGVSTGTTSTLIVGDNGAITIGGVTGVKLSATDGVLTMAGVATANDRDLIFDFDSGKSDFKVSISSSTVVDEIEILYKKLSIRNTTAQLELQSTVNPTVNFSHFMTDMVGDLTITASGGNVDFDDEILKTTQGINAGYIFASDGSSNGLQFGSGVYFFITSGVERQYLTTPNAKQPIGIYFNRSNVDFDIAFEGTTDPYLIYMDAGNNRAGIGTNSPAELFDVDGLSRCQSLTLDGDIGSGASSTNRITGATDTPTTDPGWATSSTVDMNSPDGYIKGYVGTQAVVIPYWNT